MNKKFSIVLVTGTMFAFLPGCASMTAEQVGQGLQVGGIGSGSGGIALIGIVTELVGNQLSKPKVGSPEFEKRKTNIYNIHVKGHFLRDYNKAFTGKPDARYEQVKESAVKYCTGLEQRVAQKEVIVLSRKSMHDLFVPDEYLPKEEEGDAIPYRLDTDPFNGKCYEEMLASAEREVEYAKIRASRNTK